MSTGTTTPDTRLAPAAEVPLRELAPAELGAWRGFLRVHSALVKALDAELLAAHGLPLTSYEVLINLQAAPGPPAPHGRAGRRRAAQPLRHDPPGRPPGARRAARARHLRLRRPRLLRRADRPRARRSSPRRARRTSRASASASCATSSAAELRADGRLVEPCHARRGRRLRSQSLRLRFLTIIGLRSHTVRQYVDHPFLTGGLAMTIVRWEPLRELGSLQSEMNRLFNTVFDGPAPSGSTMRRWMPAMDLLESGDALRAPGRPARA